MITTKTRNNKINIHSSLNIGFDVKFVPSDTNQKENKEDKIKSTFSMLNLKGIL